MRQTRRVLPAALLLMVVTGWVAAPVAAADPGTVGERLKAISPLVGAKLAGADLKAAVAVRSRQVGVSERRLELWLNLFLSHGQEGLAALGKASAVEMAREVEGTWKLRYRNVDGVRQVVKSYQAHRIIELSDSAASLQSLILEDGCLMPELCDGDPDACTFALGSFGRTHFMEVSGEGYGLLPEERAVLMSYEGRFKADGYPGFGDDVRGVIEALWVKQGDVYRTAFFQHEFRGNTEQVVGREIGPGIPPYRNDAVLTVVDDVQDMTYTELNADEMVDQISNQALIWDLAEYWNLAQSDTRLLLADVARSISSQESLRTVLQSVEPVVHGRLEN